MRLFQAAYLPMCWPSGTHVLPGLPLYQAELCGLQNAVHA